MGKIGVITENKEKYISFNIDVFVDSYANNSGEVKEKKIQLRFIDSIRFMASSLDFLELLIRKGVYWYEYMSNWDKFEETELPPKEAFYSSLNMSDISNQDYYHAQKVWKDFGI